MTTHAQVFQREYQQALSRLSSASVFDLPSPFPEVVPGQRFSVEGVTDPVYAHLNGNLVADTGKLQIQKRKVDFRTGKVVEDRNGSPVFEPVSTPKGYVAVLSHLPSKKPFKHSDPEVRYVDRVETGESGVLLFIYLIPEGYLYPFERTVLAVGSTRNMKSYFVLQVNSIQIGKFYLMVAPYTPGREYAGTRYLVAKDGTLDFEPEIANLVAFWQQHGLLPADFSFYKLDEETNLVFEERPGQLDPGDFRTGSTDSIVTLRAMEASKILSDVD